MPQASAIPAVLAADEARLLDDWLREQFAASTVRRDLMSDAELRQQSSEFLSAFRQAVQTGGLEGVSGSEWAPVRDLLSSLSRSRALQGFSPSETARFVFSLKQPLFSLLRERVPAEQLADEMWTASVLLDALGLHTSEVFQKSREEVIARQQQELLELSTPVVKVWDGVVAVPLIGTLDSARTQVVMENLLGRIVENEA